MPKKRKQTRASGVAAKRTYAKTIATRLFESVNRVRESVQVSRARAENREISNVQWAARIRTASSSSLKTARSKGVSKAAHHPHPQLFRGLTFFRVKKCVASPESRARYTFARGSITKNGWKGNDGRKEGEYIESESAGAARVEAAREKEEWEGAPRARLEQLYECRKLLWGYKASASQITYNQPGSRALGPCCRRERETLRIPMRACLPLRISARFSLRIRGKERRELSVSLSPHSLYTRDLRVRRAWRKGN